MLLNFRGINWANFRCHLIVRFVILEFSMFSFAAWKYILKFCLAALNWIALIWRKIKTLQTEKNLCISDDDGCFVSKCDIYSCYFQVVSIATKVFFGFLLQLHKSCKECRPFLRTYRTHANISEVIFQCHFCCHNPNYVYIKTRVMSRLPSWFCQIWLPPTYITCLSKYVSGVRFGRIRFVSKMADLALLYSLQTQPKPKVDDNLLMVDSYLRESSSSDTQKDSWALSMPSKQQQPKTDDDDGP